MWRTLPAPLKNRKAVLLLLVSLFSGLCLSGLLFNTSLQLERTKVHEEFALASEDRASAIERAIKSKLLVIEAMQSFFLASEDVSRDQFREFVQPFLRTEPGIQALEWIPKVELDQREEYEARIRREGMADFEFTERDSQGQMVSAGIRNEYYPVYYVEPRTGNTSAFGFDLGSNAARLDALERSRKTGEFVATAPITLVQETESQRGFLCFLPVYRGSESVSGEAEELRGFVLGVFRVGDLAASTLSYLQVQGIELDIRDGAAVDESSFLYREATAEGLSDRLWQEYLIDVGGRTWLVTTRATQRFVQARTTITPWAFLGFSLIVTALLTVVIYKTLSRTIAITETVSQRTDELRESEGHLRNSEQMLRAIVENASDFIFTLNTDGTSVYVSPEVSTLMGYEAGELLGKNCASIVHPEDIPICQAAMEEMVQFGDSCFSVEYRALKKDGSERWHSTTGSAIKDTDGEVTSVVCVARDITDSRRREDALRVVALHDSLTGLPNRGSFDTRFDQEWRRAVRDGSELSVVLIDIDHFKQFNDSYGHQAGDSCLERVASALSNPFKRPSDFVARYGGEEFVAVLPGTDSAGAWCVCERIQAEIAALNIEHRESRTDSKVTASVGIASVQPNRSLTMEDLLEWADKALYAAKAAGRNRVCMDTPVDASEPVSPAGE
jgi:diguanylate cyclase (GGDEF)-like protein/PAS domain S-box-containing protein